ncbi:MAG: alpha/beta hydrolase [Steroidobacteraceae bacterium]
MRRRQLLKGLGALLAQSAVISRVAASTPPRRHYNPSVEYGQETLPDGIRSRRIDNNNGVTLHVLEAGFESPGRPAVLLLHGFPELAYTWRNQLLPLSRAGFHAIAPDLRGVGRSCTVPVAYDDDLAPYALLNRVADVLGLVRALGYQHIAAIVGHDWGGPTAAYCALVRPDVFQSVVLVSTPFDGTPELPLGTADHPRAPEPSVDIEKDLAALPHPRKHYRYWSASRGANEDMWHAPQGVHDLLRALFYFKSADWKGNRPFPLKSWTAAELAKMPRYYIMDLDKGVAATVAAEMPTAAQVAVCRWMTEQDLAVYTAEYTRTGFQGGLNLYRIFGSASGLRSFAGRTIDVPSCYIAGASEWGVYQNPGAFEAMQHGACTKLLGVHLVKGAGHSVVEERPAEVNRLLLEFLRRT